MKYLEQLKLWASIICGIAVISLLIGCAATATKYTFKDVTRKCYFWEKCKEKEIQKKVLVEQYKCRGTGCEAKFGTGGEVKGGKFLSLPPLKLQN